MDIEKFSWLKASDYRQKVLISLVGIPKTPKDIAEQTDYYLSHVSKTITELEKHGLAKCLTPDKRKGRLYTTTEEGEKLAEKLNS